MGNAAGAVYEAWREMSILRMTLMTLWGISFLYLSCSLLYHYALLFLALLARPAPIVSSPQQPRFAVLVPAHNEESVITKTIEQIKRQIYPQDRYDVFVIADHCTDRTIEFARSSGAIVLERNKGPRGRKAFALQWGISELLAQRHSYDAVIVLDADSLLDPLCLAAFAPFVSAGHQVLQGQHIIAHPISGRFAAVADIDMRLNNLLRNQAKMAMGLSARLMGDVMCFRWEIIERFGWPTESLGEDREFGLQLLLHGVRVHYVPQAISYGQAAPRWKDATQQRIRWYGGAQSIQTRYFWPLFRRALKGRDIAALDLLLELILPPYSVAVVVSFCFFITQLIFPYFLGLIANIGVIFTFLLWFLFPLMGLVASHAPVHTFVALRDAPFYILWRLFTSICARFRGQRIKWVRTRRNEEISRQ